MRWELDYQDKANVIEAALDRGLPMPKWARNEPVLFPGDEFYISAFWELSTCRQLGMSYGPIPWTDILIYGQFAGLDYEAFSIFVRVMRAMDSKFLQWAKEKNKND